MANQNRAAITRNSKLYAFDPVADDWTEVLVDENGNIGVGVEGVSTAANQTTIIGHVDGIEALLTTIDADTSTLAGVDFATQTTLAAINAKLVTGTVIGDVNAIQSGTWTNTVQGTQADAATITDNPVLIGGENPSGALKRLQTAPDGDLIVHHHTASQAMADGVSNTQRIPVNESDQTYMPLPVFPWVFNGTTWDRLRGDSTNGLTVNLGSNNDVTVPGVSTEAKQDTIIGHIDGIESLLTTIDADTSALAAIDYATETTLAAILVDTGQIEALLTTIDADTSSMNTDIATIAGAVSGTEMQVDVLTMPEVTTAEKKSSTGTHSNTTSSASNQTLLASNASRLGATVFNDADKDLYLKLGATASTSSFTIKVATDGYYEVPYGYTGIIDGLWDTSPTGSARVVEFTA